MEHERNETEFALIISDAFQGKGLGTRSPPPPRRDRSQRASRSVRRIHSPGNRHMLDVCRRLGFHHEHKVGDPMVVSIIELTQRRSSRRPRRLLTSASIGKKTSSLNREIVKHGLVGGTCNNLAPWGGGVDRAGRDAGRESEQNGGCAAKAGLHDRAQDRPPANARHGTAKVRMVGPSRHRLKPAFVPLTRQNHTLTCPDRDARHRILGHGNRESGNLAEQGIESTQQRAASGQDHSAIDEIGR
jgi:hypothetical protein